MMDRRRAPASWKRRQQKEMKNPLLFTLVMYFVLGIFIGSTVLLLKSLLVSMIFIHAYLLFMMAMTLVTDFSAVLLDTTDNHVLLPKPVTSRTIFLARVIHILVYLLQFLIALTLAPLVLTFFQYGPAVGVALLITLPLTVTFAIFITYLLYALILRYGNEQKIKDIIGYFQVFMTVFFAVGYQVIPRLINFDNGNFTINLHWYSYLLAPVWMAMSIEAVKDVNFDQIHLLMIACAAIIPPLTAWLMVRFLAPSFSRKLNALNNNVDLPKVKTGMGKVKVDYSQRLARIFCTSKTESAGFELVWKMTGRDKSFKVQFYPSLAYLLVFTFIFIFKSGSNVLHTWEHLQDTKTFLWFVYLPLMTISSALSIIPFNENFAAGWVYQATPLSRPGELLSATVKALFAKFFLPVYSVLFGFGLYVWGASVIDDFILGFFNNSILFLVIANLSEHILPFSRQANLKQQTGKFLRVLLQLALVGMLIGLHFLALRISWLPAALIPVSALGGYFLLSRLQQLSWYKNCGIMPVNIDLYKEIKLWLDERNVTLIAVSKLKPVEDILTLYNLGHRDFGENYVQELAGKYEVLPKDIRWHFIGHLQSNKVKLIAPFVYLCHGVDSEKLLVEINKQGKKTGRTIPVLLQVYISKDETKFGFDEQELETIFSGIGANPTDYDHTEIRGLLGMATFTQDNGIITEEFENLNRMFKNFQGKLPLTQQHFSILSMGMSADYKLAVKAGSNAVRVGSLIFGERNSTGNAEHTA